MSAGRFIELLEMAEILVVQTIEKCKNKNLTYKPEQGNALLEEMREIQKKKMWRLICRYLANGCYNLLRS